MDSEIQSLLTSLDGIKNRAKAVVEKLGDEGVKWKPAVQDTNSAAMLLTHMLGSESGSIHGHVGGMTVNRNRDEEFSKPVSTAKGLLELIDKTGARTREVVSKESSQSLGRTVPSNRPGVTRTAREAILGTLTHESEHLGHLEMTEQLWRARKG